MVWVKRWDRQMILQVWSECQTKKRVGQGQHLENRTALSISMHWGSRIIQDGAAKQTQCHIAAWLSDIERCFSSLESGLTPQNANEMYPEGWKVLAPRVGTYSARGRSHAVPPRL